MDDKNKIREKFLCLVEMENSDGTTAQELSKRKTDLPKLIVCAFDRVATFSGNIAGVR